MEPTRTKTVQIQPQPTISIKDTLKPDSIVNRLTEIMETVGASFYSQWKDPLSLKLMEWGCEIIAIDTIEVAENEAEFIEAANMQLIKLVNEVMVDTLIKTPLQEPMLVVETRWTCEKEFLVGCNHGKKLTVVTHDFALAIFKWAFSLISKQEQGALTQTGESFVPGEEAYRAYRFMVRQAYADHQLGAFIQETKENTELMKLFMEMVDKRSKEHIDKAKEESKKALAEVAQRIADLELTSDQKTEALKQVASDLSQQVNKCEKEVVALQQEVGGQRNEIAALRAAYYQRCQEVQALREQACKKRPWWKFW